MKDAALNFLKRAYLALESEEFDEAEAFLEQALNEDAECYEAYFGKLLCQFLCKDEAALIALGLPVEKERFFTLAYRFGDDTVKAHYDELCQKIRSSAIQKATVCANDTNKDYSLAIQWLSRIGEDNSDLACFCEMAILTDDFSTTDVQKVAEYAAMADAFLEQAQDEALRLRLKKCNEEYMELIQQVQKAIEEEERRNEEEKRRKAEEEKRLIEEKKRREAEEKRRIKEEKRRIEEEKRKEAEKRAEEKRIEAERQAKEARKKKVGCVIFCVIAVLTAITIFTLLCLNDSVWAPAKKYEEAMSAINKKDYKTAIELFEDLERKDYKDSAEQKLNAKYLWAEQYYQATDYVAAINLYRELGNYKDSKEKVSSCRYEYLLKKKDFRTAIEEFSLSEFAFPSGTTSIQNIGGLPLQKVSIPVTVTKIEWGAFQDCSQLTEIHYEGTVAQWYMVGKNWFWDAGTGEYTVYCTDGTLPKPKE